MVNIDNTTIIEQLLRKEEWQRARILIRKELVKSPKSHWLLTRLSSTYYETRQYKRALFFVEKALELAPKCPLVLWDYAGCLDMLHRENEAIAIWKSLIKRGANKIAKGQCGEGIIRARELVNDCRFRIAFAYLDIGQKDCARRYLQSFINKRRQGQRSMYGINKAKELLEKCES